MASSVEDSPEGLDTFSKELMDNMVSIHLRRGVVKNENTDPKEESALPLTPPEPVTPSSPRLRAYPPPPLVPSRTFLWGGGSP